MGKFRDISRWLSVLLFISAHAIFAADSVRTLAIMNVDAGASGLMVDALTAEMSSDLELRLVERDAIARLVREQGLSALGLVADTRIKLGQLVGADDLVLVGKNPGAGTNALQVLICDSATGARLGQIQAAISGANMSSLAKEIRNVLSRFPYGVQSVVAVPDFVSEDLRLENAGLQTGLAEVLRGALAREPGLALMEFDEAKTLAGEHELTGGQVRRFTPVYVEGKYRTYRSDAGDSEISMVVTMRMAEHDDIKLESGQVPLKAVGKFLLGEVQGKIMTLVKSASVTGFDPGQEFARLIERADEFAEIGDFDRATGMREAALLLQPEATTQRIRLVQDYSVANSQLVGAWPKGAERSAKDTFWVKLVAHRRETWRRALAQVEYLVRNRCVDMTLGTRLVGQTIHSITGIRATEAHQLAEEEDLKKEFLRDVASALFNLPGKKGPVATREERGAAANLIIEEAFFRMDGNFLTADDLALAGDLLCNALPADTPLSMNLIYLLQDGTRRFGGTSRDVSPEAWTRFVQRLLNSPRPLIHAYGRYARLCDQRIREKQASEDMLTEAKSLAEDASRPPLTQLDPRGELHHVATENAFRIEMALGLKKPTKVVPTALEEAEPVLQPDGSYLCDRVLLKPLKLSITRSTISEPNAVLGSADHLVRCRGLQKAWEGMDVIYSRTSVVVLRTNFDCEEIFVDQHNNIGCVVFDGKYVWISTGYDRGVYVIDRDGKTVASIGPNEGLPQAYATMPLLSLGPGRIMAAGSIQQSRRGWLATVDLVQGKPLVKVFHEAIKSATTYGDRSMERMFDPAMSFAPAWIMEFSDAAKKRWAFVGRGRSASPLVVDLDTLAVTVYPASPADQDCFPRTEDGVDAFFSHNGLLYVAGSNRNFKTFRFDSRTHLFSLVPGREDEQWDYGAMTGCLVEYGGYIYYAGSARWLRHPIAGGPDEVLVASPRSLPHYGSGDGWTLGTSYAAGLVAWSGGQLYQAITISGPK